MWASLACFRCPGTEARALSIRPARYYCSVIFIVFVYDEVEVVSITPLKSEPGFCTMLSNLNLLHGPLHRAASTDDTISVEVRLVGAFNIG